MTRVRCAPSLNDCFDECDWVGTSFLGYIKRPAVAGAIVGTRLGLTDHSEDNRRVFGLKLDDEDRSRRVISVFFSSFVIFSSNRLIFFPFSLLPLSWWVFFFDLFARYFPFTYVHLVVSLSFLVRPPFFS